MQRRHDANAKKTSAGSVAGAVALVFGLLAGCSTDPYEIQPNTNPPWELFRTRGLPVLDPPLSQRAHRIALCYGTAVNTEADIVERAAELCGGGRLVLEDQNTFWNGCSVLQPKRVTYICDPPAEAEVEK